MSHNVNLGQASFQTEDSPLQLQLKAIGHFKLPINDSMQLSEDENIQLPHLTSAWVSEAPELELRLHVNISLCLEWSLSRFISSLGENICDSVVWPNLGFTIVFKSCETAEENNGSRTSCLTFGLCKGTCSIGQLPNRKVPLILRNPPASHPPTVYPSVLLAAIDMYLEYSLSLEAESQGDLEAMVQTDNILRDLDSGSGCSTFATQTYSPERRMEEEMHSLVADDCLNLLQVEALQPHLLGKNDNRSLDTTHLLSTAYQLLDKALQRLISARPSRNIERNTIPDSAHSLAKMTDLAPAIFNPLYRQAIDQRAVSIPIISKALASMIKGSRNSELKSISRVFLQRFDTSFADTADVSDHKRLTNAIQSSLWSIAQAQLRDSKNVKKVNSFFRSDNESAILDPSTLLDTGLGLNMLLEPDICSNHDSELLDSNLEFNYNYHHDNIDYSIFDQNITQDFDYTETFWPMDWLDSDGDEVLSEPSVFEYISDSDPTTTIDSIFSSCENTQFSQQMEFENELPRSSSDMLLCEEDRNSDEDGLELLCEF